MPRGRDCDVLAKPYKISKIAEHFGRFAKEKIADLLPKNIAKIETTRLDGRHLLFKEYLLD